MKRFPDTRQTLIYRIADDREADDWKIFLDDYWGPVVRFAEKSGRLNPSDAEDVAADMFEALVSDNLLARWLNDRRAKLRTVLCAVVKNLISNRARVQTGRERIMAVVSLDLLKEISGRQSDPDDDCFCDAWVDELLRRTLNELQRECAERNRIDAFRVFYGRIVDGLSNPEIAQYLGISISSVENHYKRIRDQFSRRLRMAIELHVRKYGTEECFEEEVELEWNALAEHLKARGELESVFREIPDDEILRHREFNSKATALRRLIARLDRERT